MELHTLRPAAGAVKKVKRIARGEGSGHGGTATRGHKGDKARTGHKNKRNHEGGQMPLQMRLPKRGFKNINRVEYVAFNLDRLESLAEKHNVEMIDFDFLMSHHLVSKTDKIKVLGGGELTRKLEIRAHGFSEKAKEKIEGLGGVISLV